MYIDASTALFLNPWNIVNSLPIGNTRMTEHLPSALPRPVPGRFHFSFYTNPNQRRKSRQWRRFAEYGLNNSAACGGESDPSRLCQKPRLTGYGWDINQKNRDQQNKGSKKFAEKDNNRIYQRPVEYIVNIRLEKELARPNSGNITAIHG
jgi:hypothetical protein